MKRSIIILSLLMAFSVITTSANDRQMDTSREQSKSIRETEIVIRPTLPRPGRSFSPIVNAMIDYDCNIIEVDFECEMGNVTILIMNQMGQVVTRYACDTNMEATVCLQSPAVEGAYTIRIIGTDYEGEGYFEI